MSYSPLQNRARSTTSILFLAWPSSAGRRGQHLQQPGAVVILVQRVDPRAAGLAHRARSRPRSPAASPLRRRPPSRQRLVSALRRVVQRRQPVTLRRRDADARDK